MEEAFGLSNYLPISFKTQGEQDYIAFLWETFEANYEQEKYQFAFLAYHLLMMSFVYFTLWQVKQAYPKDFEKGLIGFRDEKDLLAATSPFTFSQAPERTILGLLKLIDLDDSKINNCRGLVNFRNNTAHSNGNIFLSTQEALDNKINEVSQAVDEIQTQSRTVVKYCYHKFLRDSLNPEEREYNDPFDQTNEVLIHDNYMSQKDIEICISFDIADSFKEQEFSLINDLHLSLIENYGNDE